MESASYPHDLDTNRKADEPGWYITTADCTAITDGFDHTSTIERDLDPGTRVHVVEVRECEEAKRVRGRIDEPQLGWVSLLNTADGGRWAIRE